VQSLFTRKNITTIYSIKKIKIILFLIILVFVGSLLISINNKVSSNATSKTQMEYKVLEPNLFSFSSAIEQVRPPVANKSELKYNIDNFEAQKLRGEDGIVSKQRIIDGSSPYIIKAGSFIPCILKTTLNSDIGGTVVGIVNRDLYDTLTGNYLLIPKGTMVIGRYNNAVNYGQNRLQVFFHRLDFPYSAQYPYGYTLKLNNLDATDTQGSSGLIDKVNNHFGNLVYTTILSTAISLNKYKSRARDSFYPFYHNHIGGSLEELNKNIVNNYKHRTPSIIISDGTIFNILVKQDLQLREFIK